MAKTDDSHWMVAIDEERCSLCEVCVHHCPTGALSSERAEQRLRVIFRSARCNGCNDAPTCRDRCPEEVVRVSRSPGPADSEGRVLAEGELLQCGYCNAWFAPLTKVDTVSRKTDA